MAGFTAVNHPKPLAFPNRAASTATSSSAVHYSSKKAASSSTDQANSPFHSQTTLAPKTPKKNNKKRNKNKSSSRPTSSTYSPSLRSEESLPSLKDLFKCSMVQRSHIRFQDTNNVSTPLRQPLAGIDVNSQRGESRSISETPQKYSEVADDGHLHISHRSSANKQRRGAIRALKILPSIEQTPTKGRGNGRSASSSLSELDGENGTDTESSSTGGSSISVAAVDSHSRENSLTDARAKSSDADATERRQPSGFAENGESATSPSRQLVQCADKALSDADCSIDNISHDIFRSVEDIKEESQDGSPLIVRCGSPTRAAPLPTRERSQSQRAKEDQPGHLSERQIIERLRDIGVCEVGKAKHCNDIWEIAKKKLEALKKDRRNRISNGRRDVESLKTWAGQDLWMKAESSMNDIDIQYKEKIREGRKLVKELKRLKVREGKRKCEERNCQSKTRSRMRSSTPCLEQSLSHTEHDIPCTSQSQDTAQSQTRVTTLGSTISQARIPDAVTPGDERDTVDKARVGSVPATPRSKRAMTLMASDKNCDGDRGEQGIGAQSSVASSSKRHKTAAPVLIQCRGGLKPGKRKRACTTAIDSHIQGETEGIFERHSKKYMVNSNRGCNVAKAAVSGLLTQVPCKGSKASEGVGGSRKPFVLLEPTRESRSPLDDQSTSADTGVRQNAGQVVPKAPKAKVAGHDDEKASPKSGTRRLGAFQRHGEERDTSLREADCILQGKDLAVSKPNIEVRALTRASAQSSSETEQHGASHPDRSEPGRGAEPSSTSSRAPPSKAIRNLHRREVPVEFFCKCRLLPAYLGSKRAWIPDVDQFSGAREDYYAMIREISDCCGHPDFLRSRCRQLCNEESERVKPRANVSKQSLAQNAPIGAASQSNDHSSLSASQGKRVVGTASCSQPGIARSDPLEDIDSSGKSDVRADANIRHGQLTPPPSSAAQPETRKRRHSKCAVNSVPQESGQSSRSKKVLNSLSSKSKGKKRDNVPQPSLLSSPLKSKKRRKRIDANKEIHTTHNATHSLEQNSATAASPAILSVNKGKQRERAEDEVGVATSPQLDQAAISDIDIDWMPQMDNEDEDFPDLRAPLLAAPPVSPISRKKSSRQLLQSTQPKSTKPKDSLTTSATLSGASVVPPVVVARCKSMPPPRDIGSDPQVSRTAKSAESSSDIFLPKAMLADLVKNHLGNFKEELIQEVLQKQMSQAAASAAGRSPKRNQVPNTEEEIEILANLYPRSSRLSDDSIIAIAKDKKIGPKGRYRKVPYAFSDHKGQFRAEYAHLFPTGNFTAEEARRFLG